MRRVRSPAARRPGCLAQPQAPMVRQAPQAPCRCRVQPARQVPTVHWPVLPAHSARNRYPARQVPTVRRRRRYRVRQAQQVPRARSAQDRYPARQAQQAPTAQDRYPVRPGRSWRDRYRVRPVRSGRSRYRALTARLGHWGSIRCQDSTVLTGPKAR